MFNVCRQERLYYYNDERFAFRHCALVNKGGQCALFEQKPGPWWKRIFGRKP